MPIKSAQHRVAEANAEIDTWTQETALEHLNDESVQFVDIRDVRELWREGTIPNSVHAPRGMLEFWFDPASPYARDVFQQDKTFLLFCASGCRSALAAKTLTDMGVEKVAHIEGGFSEWKESGYPIEDKEKPGS